MGLFKRPQARNTDPITSHEAAATITEEMFYSRTEMVRRLLTIPMTDEQLVLAFEAAAFAGLCKPASPQGIRSARAVLVKDNKIEAVPDKFELTAMGNKCHVWQQVK